MQTEVKTTTQTVTQEPEQQDPLYSGQMEQGQINEGQLTPVVTNAFQSSEGSANFQGITHSEGEVLPPIYTKEIKNTQVHDLGTVNLGTTNLGTIDLGTKNLGTVDLGT